MSDTSKFYRLLPSVDGVLDRLAEEPDLAARPRPFLKDLVTETLDDVRKLIREGRVTEEDLDAAVLLSNIIDTVRRRSRPHFRRVINATGVVLHTNLGRSLLADGAVQAVSEACARYSNLEFDLETGKRGSRYSHVEDTLKRVTGAEAGLVVNNNAAAVLLVLDTLCKGGEVIVSRGELVEIGGSFRIPEVMEKSGAFLREVGATNRTHLHDYENAITEETTALLKVHASNYRIIGFTKEVSIPELRTIAQPRGLPVIEDLGSGTLFDFAPFAFGYEPTVQEKVAQGADVITFSGDKVLGGPQAGIIVGRAEFVERIKKNPLNRALRIDKMTLAALEATLRLYMDPELARKKIPTLAMMTAASEDLRKKADRLARRLRRTLGDKATISLMQGASRVGGGSFPERDLETTLVRVVPASERTSLEALRDRLLEGDPPLVGRIEDDAFCLDPRTLAEDELSLAAELLGSVFGGPE